MAGFSFDPALLYIALGYPRVSGDEEPQSVWIDTRLPGWWTNGHILVRADLPTGVPIEDRTPLWAEEGPVPLLKQAEESRRTDVKRDSGVMWTALRFGCVTYLGADGRASLVDARYAALLGDRAVRLDSMTSGCDRIGGHPDIRMCPLARYEGGGLCLVAMPMRPDTCLDAGDAPLLGMQFR